MKPMYQPTIHAVLELRADMKRASRARLEPPIEWIYTSLPQLRQSTRLIAEELELSQRPRVNADPLLDFPADFCVPAQLSRIEAVILVLTAFRRRTEEIASVLHLSVNTVYAYRSRMAWTLGHAGRLSPEVARELITPDRPYVFRGKDFQEDEA